MMRRALAIRERRGGKDPDDDIGSSFHNLGVLHKRKGDFATAATYYQQAIVVKEKRWGVRHPRYLNSYEQLGDTLSQLGKYEEAEKILRASLALRRETHGEKSSRVMLVMRDLASLLVASGDFVEAIPQFEKSIAIGKIASGQRAILLAPILSRLAEAHELTGAIKKADGLHKEVLSILTDTPLTDALSLAFVRHRYGKFLLNQQKADLAKPMLFEAERVRQQKLAADDPLNLQATIGVAAYMINKNEISDALARLGRVAPHIQKLHPIDRAEWFRLSAHAANATGDKVAAKDHLTASRELLQTFLKPGDKRIALAMQDIKGR